MSTELQSLIYVAGLFFPDLAGKKRDATKATKPLGSMTNRENGTDRSTEADEGPPPDEAGGRFLPG